jgi:hypothetical protein
VEYEMSFIKVVYISAESANGRFNALSRAYTPNHISRHKISPKPACLTPPWTPGQPSHTTPHLLLVNLEGVAVSHFELHGSVG